MLPGAIRQFPQCDTRDPKQRSLYTGSIKQMCVPANCSVLVARADFLPLISRCALEDL
jgi:hypothetical protein